MKFFLYECIRVLAVHPRGTKIIETFQLMKDGEKTGAETKTQKNGSCHKILRLEMISKLTCFGMLPYGSTTHTKRKDQGI